MNKVAFKNYTRMHNPLIIKGQRQCGKTFSVLDFEEFLWAKGIDEQIINVLKDCLAKEKIVPEAWHNKMHELMLHYVVVGGMPEVVQNFVDAK